jgi:hypothetical protein
VTTGTNEYIQTNKLQPKDLVERSSYSTGCVVSTSTESVFLVGYVLSEQDLHFSHSLDHSLDGQGLEYLSKSTAAYSASKSFENGTNVEVFMQSLDCVVLSQLATNTYPSAPSLMGHVDEFP